ncbi:MAG: hypothetical protein CVT59_01200 [Actinobacteria bacterium HGW-Actinobacteria-1]|nr:MAG: hypothetical protein CVT59_01200 [Actinobacteria bacterium HGW-Actinobacteria-1]
MSTGPVDLKSRLRRCAFALLRASGVPLVLRHTVQRRRLTILLFHQQDPVRFESTLHALRSRYSLVGMAEALQALESGTIHLLPPCPLVITFDDGRASNAALVPVLRRYEVRPTVFVTTGVVGTNRHFWWTALDASELRHAQSLPEAERIAYLRQLGHDPLTERSTAQALTLEQLSELSSVADIEPHTRTHPVLTRCTAEEARAEIQGSIDDVTTLVGTTPRVFAYPNGDVNDTVSGIVAACGIRYAVTTEPVYVDRRSEPLRLGRIFIRDTATNSELIVFASGLHGMLKRMLRRAP